jgi:3-oxoacyl-[acyl-carrier-protein] synthase III
MRDDIFDAAVASINRTVADSGLPPGAIDGLILCTTTGLQAISNTRHDVGYLLSKTGLTNAFHFGLDFATCATMLTGLQVAAALISSGRFTNVVLATCDAYSESVPTYVAQKSRFSEYYVCSDGVASCVVSSNSAAQYGLVAIAFGSNHLLLDPQTSNETGRLTYLDLLGRTSSQACREADLHRSNIRQAFVGNYFYDTADSMARAMGFNSERVFRENIPKVGHCYSADNLINLKDFCDSRGRQSGDYFALASAGVGQVGVAIVRVN